MLLATRAPSMLAARNAAKRAAAPVPVARCGRRAIAVRAAMPGECFMLQHRRRQPAKKRASPRPPFRGRRTFHPSSRAFWTPPPAGPPASVILLGGSTPTFVTHFVLCPARPINDQRPTTKHTKTTKTPEKKKVGELASLSTAIARSLAPTAATLKALDLPETLIHWGHPGNMAVVLLAMLGYGGVFLGWTIRNGTADEEEIDKARDLHPKLTIGATVFFLLGATGGVISLVMQGKPILESPHFVSGMTGLALLSVQAMLPLFFSEGAGARTAHAFLGSSIFALLLVHGALGLKLGLSI